MKFLSESAFPVLFYCNHIVLQSDFLLFEQFSEIILLCKLFNNQLSYQLPNAHFMSIGDNANDECKQYGQIMQLQSTFAHKRNVTFYQIIDKNCRYRTPMTSRKYWKRCLPQFYDHLLTLFFFSKMLWFEIELSQRGVTPFKYCTSNVNKTMKWSISCTRNWTSAWPNFIDTICPLRRGRQESCTKQEKLAILKCMH